LRQWAPGERESWARFLRSGEETGASLTPGRASQTARRATVQVGSVLPGRTRASRTSIVLRRRRWWRCRRLTCARRENGSGGISDGCAEEGRAVPGCSAADGGGRDKERGVAHHTMPLREAVERDATEREMARTSSTGAEDGGRRDRVIERARSTARCGDEEVAEDTACQDA
ncbi:hypothetical protein POSPLADRAFT_1163758, partial [Postia placenta MAD-698-R-SB12]